MKKRVKVGYKTFFRQKQQNLVNDWMMVLVGRVGKGKGEVKPKLHE